MTELSTLKTWLSGDPRRHAELTVDQDGWFVCLCEGPTRIGADGAGLAEAAAAALDNWDEREV